MFEVMASLTHSAIGTSHFCPQEVIHVEGAVDNNYSKLSRLQQLHAFAILTSRQDTLPFSNEVVPGPYSGLRGLST
jgi:hypothetical protein